MIDFEAPPDEIDGAPRSPGNQDSKPDNNSSQETESAISKNSGSSLLIEKEGKFELVNESDIQDDGKNKNNGDTSCSREIDIEDLLKLNQKTNAQKSVNENESSVQEVPEEKNAASSRPVSAPSKPRSGNALSQRNPNAPPRPRSATSPNILFRSVVNMDNIFTPFNYLNLISLRTPTEYASNQYPAVYKA